MTDLLEKAVAAVRQMPATEPLDIEPEYLAAVMAGMAQADRGEFVEGEAGEIVTRAFARGRTRDAR